MWLAESRWQWAKLAGHLWVALEAPSKQAQVLQKWEGMQAGNRQGLMRAAGSEAESQALILFPSLPCLFTAPGWSSELASSPY